MKYWSHGLVKYRLHYFPVYKRYAMGREADPIPMVVKRVRRSTDAWFVNPAIENAFIDEAFGNLTEQEQKLLTELYIDGSEDQSYTLYDEWKINIVVPEEISQETALKNNLSVKEMWGIANEALEKMALYLNGGE